MDQNQGLRYNSATNDPDPSQGQVFTTTDPALQAFSTSNYTSGGAEYYGGVNDVSNQNPGGMGQPAYAQPMQHQQAFAGAVPQQTMPQQQQVFAGQPVPQQQQQQQVFAGQPMPQQPMTNVIVQEASVAPAMVGPGTYTAPGAYMGRTSCRMTCPYCKADVATAVSKECGTMTWVATIALLIISPLCFYIPMISNSCKDTVHSCPNCKRVVGVVPC